MVDGREIVSRADARIVGLKRYFTGKSCKRGHVSERTTANAMCIACESLRKSAAHAASPELGNARCKKWRENNAEYNSARTKKWADENPDKVRAAWKARSVRDRDKINARYAKRRSTVIGGINNRVSVAIWRGIRDQKSGRSWEELVGYDANQLCTHLERQFTYRMGWHNRDKWHIDHIVPLSSFKFTSTDDPDFRAAWAITNLRPLWKSKNLTKHAKREFLI